MDGIFFFKIDGYGLLLNEWQPPIGLDQQAVGLDHLSMYPESGVVKIGVIIYRCVLMAVPGHFDAAGRVPGLLDDDGIVGRVAGVVVEDYGIREAGADDFFAAEAVVLGLRGRLLAVEKE